MTDTGVVNSIRCMLDGVTAYEDPGRWRGMCKDGICSWMPTTPPWLPGVVERVQGGKVLVKLDHGFIARIAPGEIKLATSAKRDRDCPRQLAL
jgi:hypothetical protein